MIKELKKIIPPAFTKYYVYQRIKIAIIKDFIYDYKRFKNYSGSFQLVDKEPAQAFIIKEYHAIEKGLALRHPKKGFGVQRISKLIDVTDNYIKNHGLDETTTITFATLHEYSEFEKGNEAENPVLNKIRTFFKTHGYNGPKTGLGGTKNISKSDVTQHLNFDFDSFFKSRFSTRDFTTEPVDPEILQQAIQTALHTPSVCNRQAWKVYLIDPANHELRNKFLNVQNGNKGFGEYMGALLIITGKLSSFFAYERNQVYVDGGMFAMSVVLALHSKGLGTCCLNTSYTAKKNEAFREVMKMDDDCVPIMFIAVGHLKDNYKVAVSQRKPISAVVEIK